MSNALIIFAREPVPGQVKTRLAASIGNLAAAELYSAMLQDVLQTVSELHDITPMIFWAGESIPHTKELFKKNVNSYLQSPGDLGKRLVHAFDTAFAFGYKRCCIIGSDTPSLPAEYVIQAFELLGDNRRDVVFGPATDGGYYLIGMRQTYAPLFNGITWSSEQTLEESCEKASKIGIRYALLPEWYDIDTLEDLNSAYRKGLSSESKTCQAIERLIRQPPKGRNSYQ